MKSSEKTAAPATVIILPVIRIERYPDEPPTTSPTHRSRRRRFERR
jgi:hypothetical protein